MTIPLLKMDNKLAQLRTFLKEAAIDAWLIYDFRGFDSTGSALLGHLAPHSRQYAIIITQDDPVIIIRPRIESHELADLSSTIHVFDYHTQADFKEALKLHASRFSRIAINKSKNPQTDVLPAGRFALLCASLANIEWVSGENLMQIVHSVLTKTQLASHERAARICTQIMKQAFAFITEAIGTIREYEVANYIHSRFQEEKLITENSPMVAVQVNTANPHYTAGDTIIGEDRLIMIDLWAKWDIYADMTWMAYTGTKIPAEMLTIWDVVLKARKTATNAIKPHIPARIPDEKARKILIGAGYGSAIMHRTGHNIDTTAHGKGANLDSIEMPESRLLLPNLVVSVEPGLYFPGRFGIRSEINVIVTDTGHKISTPPQDSIVTLQ